MNCRDWPARRAESVTWSSGPPGGWAVPTITLFSRLVWLLCSPRFIAPPDTSANCPASAGRRRIGSSKSSSYAGNCNRPWMPRRMKRPPEFEICSGRRKPRMNLDNLTHTSGEWLRGQGPESDIVISSRIRLARNLAAFPFTNRASGYQKAEIETLLRDRIAKMEVTPRLGYLAVPNLSALDRQMLVERQPIRR